MNAGREDGNRAPGGSACSRRSNVSARTATSASWVSSQTSSCCCRWKRAGAQVTGAEIAEQDALWAKPLERAVGLGDRDEVRLDSIRIDAYACVRETLAEAARACVILGEPVDVVVERVERRGGEHAGL